MTEPSEILTVTLSTAMKTQPLTVRTGHQTTLKGFTVDNLETGALNADNLWTVVQSLANQLSQDGEAGGQLFQGILVPFILLKTVHETLDSDLIPFSGENQENFFRTVYGTGIRIKASIFLGSNFNANTNAATSYHVISENVQACRRVLTGLEMTLIEPKFTANDTYVERARFMESHFITSHFGSVHSNGST